MERRLYSDLDYPRKKPPMLDDCMGIQTADVNTAIERICSSVTEKSYIGMFGVGGPYPKRGQFVIRGAHFATPILQRVGYVTQIRVGSGQFKSDMYFLRLANGSLITSENDVYLPMTVQQEAIARTVFTTTPEQEGFDEDPAYRDCGGVEESGFIVENSNSEPSPDTSFSIMLTTQNSHG